ncbi:MAG: helix-turn-helix domain-containing protein [Bacillota bacterium]|nr:helix-turn-helix domain-containing protein [Bacillota bacterium]
MPKGEPNKRYTTEFKQMVVETMQREKLSYKEVERQYDLPHNRAAAWERIYLTEGAEDLKIERRGCGSKGHPRKIPKEKEEDLLAEVQPLRAGVEYLKKLNALVLEEERRDKRRK